MQAYEDRLSELLSSRDIVGASAFVANANGETLYSHYAGHQSLEPDASQLTSSTTLTLYSGGKFIAHIATLQLIEQGLADLDEPIYKILPEFQDLPVIVASSDASSNAGFELVPRKKDMTLRHMLSNSSGIPSDDHPLVMAWSDAGGSYSFPDDAPMIVKRFTRPLLFEPGEGWHYGHDVHFLQVVIERLSGMGYVRYVKKHVFDALGMTMSGYLGSGEDAENRLIKNWLRAAERGDDGVVRSCKDNMAYGCIVSSADMQTLLVDLISKTPRALKTKEAIDELFSSSLHAGGLKAFQKEAFEFAGAPANIPKGQSCPLVGYTCGGAMIIEQDGLVSPCGSLVWDGMLNIAWAANRSKGICMFWGTQQLPEYDEKTLALMKVFFATAWAEYS